ncbi:snoal-like polyketide cyclase family protein [Stemphylium lycopersici]|nr:snoal-like polyketide cyclase family protein [Stemphylium lycopersici]
MRFAILASALIAPIAVFAAPATLHSRSEVLVDRQAAPIKPAPCVRNMNVTVEETAIRAEAFAQAFIYEPNISEAFKYITQDYINHNPAAQNGSDSAWELLSPVWDSQDITPLRRAFGYPHSWVNYQSAFGIVVDRYRWEGGCIVEHWDQGEGFPVQTSTPVEEVCEED